MLFKFFLLLSLFSFSKKIKAAEIIKTKGELISHEQNGSSWKLFNQFV